MLTSGLKAAAAKFGAQGNLLAEKAGFISYLANIKN